MIVQLTDDAKSLVNVTNVDTIKRCWKKHTVDGVFVTTHMIHVYFKHRFDHVVYSYMDESGEVRRDDDCNTVLRNSR